jgi:hypothetical protein
MMRAWRRRSPLQGRWLGRLDRNRSGMAGWWYLNHDLVTSWSWGKQDRQCTGPAARGCRPARSAGWRYPYQDLVTRSSQAWPVGPSLTSLASVGSVAKRGSNAMAERHASIARRVVSTRRNGRHEAVSRPWPRRHPSRLSACMYGGYGVRNTPSLVCGAGRWPRWRSIRARHHAIAVTSAARRRRERARPSGCAGCGSDGSRYQTLRGLRYRNSTARLAAQCCWGVCGEVLMSQAPRHIQVPLRLQVIFEPTRLAAEQLAAAYDSLLPGRCQRRRPPTAVPSPPALEERARRAQEGA